MKKIFNFRLSVICAICVCLGIISANLIVQNKYIFACVILSLAIFLSLTIFINDKCQTFKVKLFVCIITFLFTLCGLISFGITIERFSKANLQSRYYKVTGKVEDIREYEFSSVLLLSNCEIDGKREGKIRYKISLNVNGDLQDVEIGSVIKFASNLSDNSLLYEGSISSYNIQSKVKYKAEVNSSDIEIIDFKPNVFQKVNLFIRNTLKSGLDQQEFAVAYAMLTGNDNFIDGMALNNYRNAGIAHIFAVSGLHIGFLATAISYIFSKTKLNKKLSFVIIIITLFLYSGVCGFTASSLRAVVMCAVLLSSRLGGAKYDLLSSIGIAGCIILLVKPIELFCVGFQLSFCVVTVMAIMTKPLARLLSFMPKKLSNSLSAVLSAQIASIPICLNAFGQFSVISVIFNLVFIPIASVIFIMLITLVLIGGIFSIPKLTLFIPNYILKVVNFIVNALDYKFFIIGGFVLGGFAIFYYLTILIASGILNLNKITKLVASILSVVILVAGTIIINIKSANQTKMYVNGIDTMCSTLIQTSKEDILIINKTGNNVPLEDITRFASEQNISSIDYLVLADNKTNVSLHHLVTRLNGVFNIKNLIYYGEVQEEQERVINYFFKQINLYNLKDDEYLQIGSSKGSYYLQGNCFGLQIKNEKIAFFSEMADNPKYVGLDNSFGIFVAVDYCDRLVDTYQNVKMISYKRSPVYDDGQSEGRFCYIFE